MARLRVIPERMLWPHNPSLPPSNDSHDLLFEMGHHSLFARTTPRTVFDPSKALGGCGVGESVRQGRVLEPTFDLSPPRPRVFFAEDRRVGWALCGYVPKA